MFKLEIRDDDDNFLTLHYEGSKKDATEWAEEVVALLAAATNMATSGRLLDAEGNFIQLI